MIVLLGLPAGGLAEFVTKGYTRVGTCIGFFAALIALGGPGGQKLSIRRLAIYTSLVGLTLFSDTYMLVMAVAAVLIVCMMGAFRREFYENLGLGRIAVATCLAVIVGQAGTWLIRALGGFEAQPLPLKEYLSAKDPARLLADNAGRWRRICPCSIVAICRRAAGTWRGSSGCSAGSDRFCSPSRCGAGCRCNALASDRNL